MKDIRILLPQTLRFMRNGRQRPFQTNLWEYRLYFSNVISPFSDDWDVVVECAYGENRGDHYYLCTYERVDSFPLTIAVYENGCRLAEKKVEVRLCDPSYGTAPYRVLFLGDSMTRSETYFTHAVEQLWQIQSIGTRTKNGWIRHEGRGGWSIPMYLERFAAEENTGNSPFLFPEGIRGEDYYGDLFFWQQVQDPGRNNYNYDGFPYEPLVPGQVFYRDGGLYRKEEVGETCLTEHPVFRFDFDKYLRRYAPEGVDAVSILMGANDLQVCSYEGSEDRCGAFLANLHTLVDLIHQDHPEVKILLNLPILGGDPYHWGEQMGCRATAGQYRYHIQNAAHRIIAEFDGKEGEGIYLCPMLAALDPVFGFARKTVHPNQYSEGSLTVGANWVHPCAAGYRQMGDILAASLEHMRQEEH